VRELANLASNLEYPVSMLEALAQEEVHPMAPPREDGPWMALLYPYIQAAKESVETIQKVAAEALVQATLFGREALLSTVKVGLVRGQICTDQDSTGSIVHRCVFMLLGRGPTG
jgi:hypothetical protein